MFAPMAHAANKNHLYKGTLSTLLLQMLAENGRMYGYEISKRAKEISNGDLDITEGALYPALHKLEAEGHVLTDRETVGNRVRKYYRLTESGGIEARDRIADLADYLNNLQLFLNPNLRHG